MTGEARDDALLHEAARDLVETLQPYRVLTRRRLESLSREGDWSDVEFNEALNWAVEHDLIRELEPDLYELARDDESIGEEYRAGPG